MLRNMVIRVDSSKRPNPDFDVQDRKTRHNFIL